MLNNNRLLLFFLKSNDLTHSTNQMLLSVAQTSTTRLSHKFVITNCTSVNCLLIAFILHVGNKTKSAVQFSRNCELFYQNHVFSQPVVTSGINVCVCTDDREVKLEILAVTWWNFWFRGYRRGCGISLLLSQKFLFRKVLEFSVENLDCVFSVLTL